jgi:hypothetical protein
MDYKRWVGNITLLLHSTQLPPVEKLSYLHSKIYYGMEIGRILEER